jgi:nucleotide-binding universal stress UspA family protein
MTRAETNPILVGIDDSPASRDAVTWAAEEASRRQLPITLVHAGYYLHEPALSADMASEVVREIDRYERRIVDEAVQAVRDINPRLEVSTRRESEAAANLLISLSDSVSMLVVGSHGEGSISGAILASISQTVAAHARCPVIVVNHRGPAANAEPTNAVVVGISPSPGSQQALRFAFERARERGCSIVAVRSWGDAGWGSLALTDNDVMIHDWQAAESALLDDCLSAITGEFSDVAVERRLVGVRAQWALGEAAIGADLLVVGCHRPDDHWFSRLGPVASWLLHRSPCPIAIVGRPQPSASEPRASRTCLLSRLPR